MGPLLEAFERTCRDRRDERAVWSRGEAAEATFGELAAAVERRAARLERLVGAGERAVPIGLAAGNSLAFLELFFALRRARVPVAVIDASLAPAAKIDLCRRLGIPALLHRDPRLGGDELGCGVLLTRPAGIEGVTAPGTAVVKVTSGSTGRAQGLCLSEEALFHGIRQIAAGMEISAADRVLIAIPLSHSYGFDNGVLSLAVVGTPLVLEPSYYPAALVAALGEGEVSFFPAVPPMIRALAESDWPPLPALERVISAGGPLAAEFGAGFRRRTGLTVHQFYGSTETGGISFETAPEEAAAEGTVGRPLPGVEVVLDAQGRVTVDSPANFHARLGDPPRERRPVELADCAAWTREGRLRLLGRAGDLLKVGGRRVSAAALEAELRLLPGVRDAAVVAVDDRLRGDRVAAFVVETGAGADLSALPRGLARRQVRCLDALPYTERGKLDRSRLRRLARARG